MIMLPECNQSAIARATPAGNPHRISGVDCVRTEPARMSCPAGTAELRAFLKPFPGLRAPRKGGLFDHRTPRLRVPLFDGRSSAA